MMANAHTQHGQGHLALGFAHNHRGGHSVNGSIVIIVIMPSIPHPHHHHHHQEHHQRCQSHGSSSSSPSNHWQQRRLLKPLATMLLSAAAAAAAVPNDTDDDVDADAEMAMIGFRQQMIIANKADVEHDVAYVGLGRGRIWRV
ncbi:hypothetical protein AWZ03_007222 [Drosophila navojoa]|uniref:Uncharacterized protein n=1 Tax=Drosophila navojoa TaxID=7232 RepID=A0A484BBZ4_DRONA|nr:hypothetical protein AWZ03_007222 [Drosophila navojoa]